MIKKLTTILLTLTLALQLVALPISHAETSTDTSEQTLIADATNKLIIPKPKTLPGPGTDQQEEGGGVKKWFTETILPTWTTGIVGFVATLSFLMLVISGFRYMTAYGNEETAGSAKKMAIYSLLALLLALFSYTIVSIIVNINFVSTG